MRSNPLFIGLALAAVLAAAAGAGFAGGRATVKAPAVVAPFPNNEQLTIASSTIVHGLEVEQGLALGDSPNFLGCHATVKPAGGIACDFGIVYYDQTAADWEIVLDKTNLPILIRRLKRGAGAQAN